MKPVSKLSVLFICTCLWAAPLLAQSRLQAYAHELLQQGYKNITVSHTFLGRGRITANKGNASREIIISASGRVLRDDSRIESSTSSDTANAKQADPQTDDKSNKGTEGETGHGEDTDSNDSGDNGEEGGGNGSGDDGGSSDDAGEGNDGGEGDD